MEHLVSQQCHTPKNTFRNTLFRNSIQSHPNLPRTTLRHYYSAALSHLQSSTATNNAHRRKTPPITHCTSPSPPPFTFLHSPSTSIPLFCYFKNLKTKSVIAQKIILEFLNFWGASRRLGGVGRSSLTCTYKKIKKERMIER